MGRRYLWADHSPRALEPLQSALHSSIGPFSMAKALDEISDPTKGDDASQIILLLSNESIAATRTLEALRWLESFNLRSDVSLVVVVGDAHLGTDRPNRRGALASAAAIAAVRSIAASRDFKARANVISIPEALISEAGTMRGPLSHEPVLSDLVDAIAFLLDADNQYVSGQVLYVNGGRQLFSSHTA